ncbi:MAG: NAD-dependent epimerase/dehydratase family protein [Chloroflexi bacterium]|nr:NAD-dependent epimerase/dehydratase family protein [Chloroflexota bacterium]
MKTPGCIVVTGGAGFIGSHVVKQLLERGEKVVVLDDLSVGSPDRVPEGAQLRVGDIRDAVALKEVLAGCHTVCHLAARVSVRASVEQMLGDADVNLMGMLQVLSACLNQGVRRLIIASSMAVYADAPDATPIKESHAQSPASPYGISKLAAEKYCHLMGQLKGLEVVVLRYFNTFGPGQTYTPYVGVITIFIRRLLEGQPPVIFGDGLQTRDFVHVDDVAWATTQAVYLPVAGETFNIGTGVGTTVNEVAGYLCQRLGPGIQPEYAPAQPGELRFSVADITRARLSLDYQPRFSLVDHLDEVISYHSRRISSG